MDRVFPATRKTADAQRVRGICAVGLSLRSRESLTACVVDPSGGASLTRRRTLGKSGSADVELVGLAGDVVEPAALAG